MYVCVCVCVCVCCVVRVRYWTLRGCCALHFAGTFFLHIGNTYSKNELRCCGIRSYEVCYHYEFIIVHYDFDVLVITVEDTPSTANYTFGIPSLLFVLLLVPSSSLSRSSSSDW